MFRTYKTTLSKYIFARNDRRDAVNALRRRGAEALNDKAVKFSLQRGKHSPQISWFHKKTLGEISLPRKRAALKMIGP
jgi:hypothetical protein